MAVRIAGTTIPNEKRVEIALTYIFGIGKVLSGKILKASGVDLNTRVKDLKEEISALKEFMKTRPCLDEASEVEKEQTHYVIEKNLAKWLGIGLGILFAVLLILVAGKEGIELVAYAYKCFREVQ